VSLVLIKTELARIWRLNGVTVLYPTAAEPHGCHGSSLQSVTALIMGSPDELRRVVGVNAGEDALALAVYGRGSRATTVAVLGDRAQRLLRVGNGSPACTPLSLSLLIARLAAHEIAHVLLGSCAHARQGLMRPAYDSRDGWLAADDACYKLEPGALEMVHRRLGQADRLAR